ncbi:MAG: hypothetical protein ACREPE_05785 [Lysobacter sp.]
MRVAFRYVRARHPFAVDAIVVLPDHLHAIVSLPEGDADYALRLRLIKTFSRQLPPGERRSANRIMKGRTRDLATAFIPNIHRAMNAIMHTTSITFTSVR